MSSESVDPTVVDPLITRASTVDELLSETFETGAMPTVAADLAVDRLSALSKACANGDRSLFRRRLERDGLSEDWMRARFTAAQWLPAAPHPPWLDDAIWVRAAMCGERGGEEPGTAQRTPFAHVFSPLIAEAESRLWNSVVADARDVLSPSGSDALTQLLLKDMGALYAAALYKGFRGSASGYEAYVRQMKSGGLSKLFDDKPVLLRLTATLTRQWLETTREFVLRLHADLPAVRHGIVGRRGVVRVDSVEGGLSDRHRGGRTVLAVGFDDGSRVIYKPKDLRIDVAWHALVERLNVRAPIQLRTPRTLARDGYGWVENIAHTGCSEQRQCRDFFRRAGAWLALFHTFAASDIHQENLIAAGDHPVPVDLETVLQPGADDFGNQAAEAQAHRGARELIADSVAAVGLLPAYGRSADQSVYAVGGIASDDTMTTDVAWLDVNSDSMRPTVVKTVKPATNLPTFGGREVGLGEHLGDFVAGFGDYARFLHSLVRSDGPDALFDGFDGLPVRKVLRPTQFYSMLLGRLRDDRTMHDGIIWSAQADFLARLADWDTDNDPSWALQRAERSALLQLNVPLFLTSSDSSELHDTDGVVIETTSSPGLVRARDRVRHLDEREIAWQTAVIRQTSSFVAEPGASGAEPQPLNSGAHVEVSKAAMVAEADAVADEVARFAIRGGTGAAWIGLNWFPDSDVSQLAVLGHDFYNGTSGIATFLAAHAKTTGRTESAQLAVAAVAYLRAQLRGRTSARAARLLGIGGATGLGSVIYTLATMSKLLQDDDLLVDAHRAATLISDQLIAGDRRLDLIGGSAGAILGLIRLYQDTGDADILSRAVACGQHLLGQPRVGPVDSQSFSGPDSNGQPLSGMSHGAAGFAYGLATLAAMTGRQDFADVACQCIRFEQVADRHPDESRWRSQWCHGSVGIGLSLLGITRRHPTLIPDSTAAIDHALDGATRDWPGHVDTLCCGSLGSVEFLREAGKELQRPDLTGVASHRLTAVLANKAATGDYRWNGGARRFNVGLFRGLAGVGYTCLREVDDSLPNLLIWE